MNKNYYIGIDPGVNTGIAIYDCSKKQLIECYSSDFWNAVNVLKSYTNACVFVEMPGTKAVWHTAAKSQAAKNRTAVNVGSVLREAELIIELAIKLHDVIICEPSRKIDAQLFEKITGWEQKTNQHSRDAAMLIFRYTKCHEAHLTRKERDR